MRRHHIGWNSIVALLFVACGAGQDEYGAVPEARVASQTEPLVGGTVTASRPEIGTFSRGCTATLIAPHYVLTAGHCSGYSTVVNSGDSVRFTDSLGVAHTYTVDRIHTFGSAPGGSGTAFQLTPDSFASNEGTNDVEILHLSTNVPSTVANPAQISASPPHSGERVTVFGYGCTNRGTGTGGGTKQYFSYNFGTNTTALCPGDSGGPVVFGNLGDVGQIWGINTGYWGTGYDVHGNVSYFKNQIVRLMQLWDSTELEVGIDRIGGDYRNFAQTTTSATECRDACIADSACRAFTSVAAGVQGPQARCWLKNSVTDWTPSSACTSGTIFAQEASIDRPGLDYSHFTVAAARPELCEASCARDTNCQSYTYVRPVAAGQLAHCWLKNGVPATSANTATVSGMRRGFEINVDRAGWDYSHFTVASDPRVCRDSCAVDPRCMAFSYVAPGLQGASAGCWLKADVSGPRSVSGVTSGMKRGLEVNTDRPGMDFRDFAQTSNVPQICQAACAADAACQSWTFTSAGTQGNQGHCWLKSGIPQAAVREGMVSGLRGVEFF